MSDLMLLGALRMLHAVYPDAPPAEPITWRQVVGRCSEAADRIEADAGAIDRLRAEVEQLLKDARRYRWIRMHTCPADLAMNARLPVGSDLAHDEAIESRVDALCDVGLARTALEDSNDEH